MAFPPQRFSRLYWLYQVVCAVALIGSALVLILGIIGTGSAPVAWMIVAGGFAMFLTLILMVAMPLLMNMESTMARQLAELSDLKERITEQIPKLKSMVENTSLSDAAKSFANREQELEALRSAIRSDIQAQKWESAMELIDEVEQRFGYKQQADTMREELDDAKNMAIQDKLDQAIHMIEKHFASHDWTLAQAEIDRLTRAVPGNAKVISLQEKLKALREQHKLELKQEWNEAVRRSDTDHAIDVLKELDQYLSPAEARELRDAARHVFKDKLLQLGVQFRFAVKEKRWQDALSAGLQLVRDFPNARMASEVREVLDTLREKARADASPQTEAANP